MKKNSFVEGAVIATAAVIITKILGMLYVIPFYGIIGEKGGALYSYAYNIYAIFLGISSAGIPTAISKMISEYNTLGLQEAKYRTFRIGKKLIGYISMTGFLIMFIFAELMAHAIIGEMTGGNTVEDVAFVIRCVSFAVLVIPYLSVTKGYIQGHSIVSPSSISNILEQIIRIFVILSGSFFIYKVLSLSLTLAVGIAVSGAFFGGLTAYLYLRHVMKKNRETLGIKEYEKKDSITNKDIIMKILGYSFPFIIINIATNIYNFMDMVLIIRGLNMLGFNASDAEFIQSAITTWSTKICMIISAFSMGMSVSLIPNIVSSFVKNDWKDVNSKVNKAYQIILIISIPCAVGLCILFAVNGLLDIPLMLLFDKIGIPSYWGAIVATITGYTISVLIATHDLRKNHNMNYKPTFVMLGKIIVPTLSMIIVLIVLNMFLPIDIASKFGSIFTIVINIIIGAPVYIGIAYKMGLLDEVFGRAYINKIIKKLTFGKVSFKN